MQFEGKDEMTAKLQEFAGMQKQLQQLQAQLQQAQMAQLQQAQVNQPRQGTGELVAVPINETEGTI